jgi:hypothetical protein
MKGNQLPSPSARDFFNIDAELVARLSIIEGIAIPEERLPAVAARLRELYELAAVLDSIDDVDIVPASVYDPSWPEATLR